MSIQTITQEFTLPKLNLADCAPSSSRAVTFSSWCVIRLLCLPQAVSGELLTTGTTTSPPERQPITFVQDAGPAQRMLESLRESLALAPPLPLSDPLLHLTSSLQLVVAVRKVAKEVSDLQPLLLHTVLAAASAVSQDERNFLRFESLFESGSWELATNVRALPGIRKRAADIIKDSVTRRAMTELPLSSTVDHPQSQTESFPVESPSNGPSTAESEPAQDASATAPSSRQCQGGGPEDRLKAAVLKDLSILYGGYSDHVYQIRGKAYWLLEEKLPTALTTLDFLYFIEALKHGEVRLTAQGLSPSATLEELLAADSLEVCFDFKGRHASGMPAVTPTLARVLPQIVQQMLLNDCPRLALSNWEVAALFYLDPTGVVHVSQFVTLDPSPRLRSSSNCLNCSMLELMLMLERHAVRLHELHLSGRQQDTEEVWAAEGLPFLTRNVSDAPTSVKEQAERSGSRRKKRKRLDSKDGEFDRDDEVGEVEEVVPNADTSFSTDGTGSSTSSVNLSRTRVYLSTEHLSEDDKRLLGLERCDAVGDIPLRLIIHGTDVVFDPESAFDLDSDRWILTFGERIGHGRLGVAYRAAISSDKQTRHVIAKVMNLQGTHIMPSDDDIIPYPTVAHRSIAAKVEAHAYLELADLQGRSVPAYYGLFASSRNPEVLVALMDDAGSEREHLGEGSASEIESRRKDVIDIFEKLHERGVVHGDVDPRHVVYRQGSSSPMLIDLEGAKLQSYTHEVKWQHLAAREMERVRQIEV